LATSSVEQHVPGARQGRALLTERFGDPARLAAERFRGGRRHGLAARRCARCHDEHDQAVTAGWLPQPVRLALPGSDRCGRHQEGGPGGRR
jgi:hypothetical protein